MASGAAPAGGGGATAYKQPACAAATSYDAAGVPRQFRPRCAAVRFAPHYPHSRLRSVPRRTSVGRSPTATVIASGALARARGCSPGAGRTQGHASTVRLAQADGNSLLRYRASCLPSRTCSISSRTNSPAAVDGALPSRRSSLAFATVDFSGMLRPYPFSFVLLHSLRLTPRARRACVRPINSSAYAAMRQPLAHWAWVP